MKEKILELLDANSEKLPSLGGSLHNPNISIGEGDAFIILSFIKIIYIKNKKLIYQNIPHQKQN